MTDKKDEPSKDKVRPGDPATPKKPQFTIDLTASEVKSEAHRSASATTAATPSTGTASSSPSAAGSSKPATTATSGGGGAASAASTIASAARTAAPQAGTQTSTQKDAGKEPATAVGAGASKSAAASATAPGSPPPVRQGGGIGRLFTHMLAGIVGGFLALLGADTLGPQLKQLGIGGGFIGQSSDEVRQRLATLEQRLTAPATANAGGDVARKLAAAETRLAEIDQRTRAIGEIQATSAQLAADTKALQARLTQQGGTEAATRITKLEQTLSTLAAAAATDPQAGRIPQLAAITGRLKDIEGSFDTKLAGVQTTLSQTIEARLGQAAEAAESARSGTQRIDRDLTSARTEAAKLTQRVEALKSDADRFGQTLRVVQEETGGLRSAVDGLKGDLDAKLKAVARPADVSTALAPVTQKLASLESSVQGVVRSEADRRVNAERILLSLELANLKRVLDRGQKFSAELAEVKKSAGGGIDLSALEKFKDQGVPTLPELIRDFGPVSGRIVDLAQEPADGTVLERLMSGAKSIVRVRRTDHAANDKSADAIVGRIEAALKDNRLGDVVLEAKALSAEARDIAKGWLDRVAARQSVEGALAGVEAQLKASLGGARAPAEKSSN